MSPSLSTHTAPASDDHTPSPLVRTATAVSEEGLWIAREHTSDEPLPMPAGDAELEALADLDDDDDEITVPTGTAALVDNEWRVDASALLDLAPPPELPDRPAEAPDTETAAWAPRAALRNTLRALGVIE